MSLLLLPLGPLGVDPELPAWLAARLGERLGAEVEVGRGMELRDEWFDPERGQFASNLVVDALVRSVPAGGAGEPGSVLALTAADLYAEERDYVFGEATLGGHWALVSLHRLRSPDSDALRRRVLVEALHELGHLAGLGHCPRPDCAMHPSRDASEADRKPTRFCPSCEPALRARRGVDGTPPGR